MFTKGNSTSKDGTKPHVHLLPMMALLVFGMIALVGVVSADEVYKGFVPVTDHYGIVTKDVDVMFNDTWRAYDDPNRRDVWANFTIPAEDAANITWAKLIVVVYSGNMTANYKGYETIALNGELLTGSGIDDYYLDLEYDPNVGANRTTTFNQNDYPYFLEVNRVTSDYINQFNVTDLVKNNASVNVHVVTDNESAKFDGRVKEVKLKIAYNDTIHYVKYWVNEGHDPITKYSTSYTDNKTYFETGNFSSIRSARLYVDYLATPSGKGTYTWNGQNLDVADAVEVDAGAYAGLIVWDMTNKTFLENNTLTYDRTNSWYKLIQAVLVVDDP